MKSFYILLVSIALSAVSCRTKDGAPGPAGENTLTQQGYISGKVTFDNDNGNTVSSSFKYEYFESLSENRFYIYDNGASSDYEIIIARRDNEDSHNYFNFSLVGYNDLLTGIEEDPFYLGNDFNFITVSDNILYEFNSYNTDITNVHLDPATGRLTFDFTGYVSYSNGTATLTGTVDVTLYRVYHSIISWG